MLRAHGMRFPKVSLVQDAFFPVNYGQKGSIDGMLAFPAGGNLLAFDAGSVRNVIPDLAECVVARPTDQVRAAFAALPEALTAPITIEAAGDHTKLSAVGRSGHAAFPAGGENAILYLARALSAAGILTGDCADAIREIAALTADPYGQSEGVAYSDEISGDLTLVYAVAHLRDGVLSLSVDCRSSITCDGEKLEAALRADWARRGAEITHFERTAPFYIPKDDPRVVAMQALYHAATGRDDVPYTMGGGTYSRVVPNAISFGPGMPGEKPDRAAFLPAGHGGAHGRDESVDIESLCVGCAIYAAAIAALDDLTD